MTCSVVDVVKDRSFSEKRQDTPVIQHTAIIEKEEMKRNILSIQTLELTHISIREGCGKKIVKRRTSSFVD